ncbi:MAG: flagellar export chaperone FliS [Sulfuricella denitrificans]|nr:flagellar export chaperone FliS [Sulfuricella denitrificans]
MNTTVAVNAYKNVSFESEITGADPHKLISLLFRGALFEIANARKGIELKEIAAKGKSISKAIAIISEGLNASLDKNVGGELAQNLSSLYDYMAIRLLDANLNNDPAILDEVAHLLGELKDAWEHIRPGSIQTAQQPAVAANAQRAYGSA